MNYIALSIIPFSICLEAIAGNDNCIHRYTIRAI